MNYLGGETCAVGTGTMREVEGWVLMPRGGGWRGGGMCAVHLGIRSCIISSAPRCGMSCSVPTPSSAPTGRGSVWVTLPLQQGHGCAWPREVERGLFSP